MPPEIVIVAAVARNGAIGRDGGLVWSEPADQRHFRTVTMGWPVIMGRRTWESLPDRFRPLPGRRNLVVSRDPAYAAPGAEVVASLDAALAAAGDVQRVCVIGGAQLYAAALPRADELELTEIDAELDGDTFFPDWDRTRFDAVSRAPRIAADGTHYAFVTWRRRG